MTEQTNPEAQLCCGTFPPSVLRPAELTAFSRGGGASTIPLVTRARGAAVFLNGQTLFEGGAGNPAAHPQLPGERRRRRGRR